MIHLWKKLQRTEEALRGAHKEVHTLKKQKKEEMSGIEEFLSNIRKLSEEKDTQTQSLEKENENLRGQIRQTCLERDAFIQDNQVIAELLLEEGLQEFAGSTPRQPVEHLLQERSEMKVKIEQLETDNVPLANVIRERDRYRSELEPLQEEVKTLTGKLAAVNRNHEIETRKLRDELECKDCMGDVSGCRQFSDYLQKYSYIQCTLSVASYPGFYHLQFEKQGCLGTRLYFLLKVQ